MSSERYLPAELCEVYREANLLFPQVEVGIVPIVARFILSRGNESLIDLLTLDFSPAQVAKIRNGMNRAHHNRKIPALTPGFIKSHKIDGAVGPDNTIGSIRVITDERIRAVWRNIVLYTIDAIVDCLLIIKPELVLQVDESEEGYRQLTMQLFRLFRSETALFDELLKIFSITVKVLESDEVKNLARDFRKALNFTDIQAGRSSLLNSRGKFHDELAEILLKNLRAEHSAFAPLIRSRSWRIFRPLMTSAK